MTYLDGYRELIRKAATRVNGEYVVPLEVLKPLYDDLEREARISLLVKDCQAVIKVETAEGVSYRIDEARAGEMWEALYGEVKGGTEGTVEPVRPVGEAHRASHQRGQGERGQGHAAGDDSGSETMGNAGVPEVRVAPRLVGM
jgi:hypothetical protein